MAVDLTKNEFWLKKIRKECEARDANKDGFISKADFELVLHRYKELGSSDEHLKILSDVNAKVIEMMGLTDPNTKLTYEEYISVSAQNSKRMEDLDEIYEAKLKTMDSDGNGVISFKEWVDMYKAAGIDTKYAKASFEAMDTDGNGVISKEEFVAYTKEFYFTAEDKLKSSIMYGPLD